MQRIEVGASFVFKPSACIDFWKQEQSGSYEIKKRLVGKIVYIHPKRRFFTVEAELNGALLRESFKIY